MVKPLILTFLGTMCRSVISKYCYSLSWIGKLKKAAAFLYNLCGKFGTQAFTQYKIKITSPKKC